MKVNVFLLGAPKCGTTAMASWIDRHPDVEVSTPKETHFFSDEIPYKTVKSIDEYHECFSYRKGKILIDASTSYLRSRSAVDNIISYNEDSRFIVMVRSPAEIAFSFHQEMLRIGFESVVDFERAWELQSLRRAGSCIPRGCLYPPDLQYKDVASVGSQLKRLFERVPMERVLVICRNEMGCKEGLRAKVCNFLGIDDQEFGEIPYVNRARLWPKWMFGLGRMRNELVRRGWYRGGSGVIQKMEIIIKKNDVRCVSRSFLKKLVQEFEEEVRIVEELIGMKLPHWREPKIPTKR